MFAIRTHLFEQVPPDTLIEDFYLTVSLAAKGHRVAYAKDAYATETSSSSVGEEIKRKVRISAGGIQAVVRLAHLLLPFHHPLLTFQYVSHRVLRWTLAPLALVAILTTATWLAFQQDPLGMALLAAQIAFYAGAWAGWLYEQKAIRLKLLYVPLYFTMMHATVFAGFWRYLFGKQSVVWEKAARKI